jgi:hypothetical protein
MAPMYRPPSPVRPPEESLDTIVRIPYHLSVRVPDYLIPELGLRQGDERS